MAQQSKSGDDARNVGVLKHSDEGLRWVMAVVPATFIILVVALVVMHQ